MSPYGRGFRIPSGVVSTINSGLVRLFVERAGVSGQIINVALLLGRNLAMNPNATLCEIQIGPTDDWTGFLEVSPPLCEGLVFTGKGPRRILND